MRVSSSGGTPEPLTSLAEGEASHRWPQVLPGGKAVLFTSGGQQDFNDGDLVVQPLPAGARTVVPGGYHGRYLLSGHLVYVHDGTLFAVPFDLDRLKVTGPPIPAVDGVTSNAGSGSAQFASRRAALCCICQGQTSAVAGRSIGWTTQARQCR